MNRSLANRLARCAQGAPWFALLLSAGCEPPRCPVGTVQQGELCRSKSSIVREKERSQPIVVPEAGARASAEGSTDSTITVVAGAGAATSRATAGAASAPPERMPSPRQWFCRQIDEACSCVETNEAASDSCDAPKPRCCFALTMADGVNCQCWPEASDPCREFKAQFPDAALLPSCPPR